MDNPSEYHARVLVERVAERAAVRLIGGESFTQCLRLNHVTTERTAAAPDGTAVTIRGRDLVHAGAWTRFLREKQRTLGWLSKEIGPLTHAYTKWLKTAYTERYRALTTTDDCAWLTQVARLAVIWQILLYKQETHDFFDPWAESEMGKVLLVREVCREMARGASRHQRPGTGGSLA